MIQSAVTSSDDAVETALRDELAQGDAMLQSAAPIMRHILSGARQAIFADEIVARVRGGLEDIARQLLDAVTAAANPSERSEHDRTAFEALVEALMVIPGLLGHLHALAVEWRLTELLQTRGALDPVVPPLLEALLASEDATTSALAMNLLAAQARFAQVQRRMEAPLNELPADLLHGALLAMRGSAQAEPQVAKAEQAIRAGYDESRTRLGLIARLVMGMGGGAIAALSLHHAGMAIFASALSSAAGQDRDVVLLSTGEGQSLRLAFTLRAAGLQQGMIEEQLLALLAEVALPAGWERLGAEQAAEMLGPPAPLGGA